MNQYLNDKLSLFLTEVNFDTLEEKQLAYFQNGYFFKILWKCHEPYNQVKMQVKKLNTISELFINKILILLLCHFNTFRLYISAVYVCKT